MWPNPQDTVDLVTFTEKIIDVKLHFLWSETYRKFDEFLLNLYGKNTLFKDSSVTN